MQLLGCMIVVRLVLRDFMMFNLPNFPFIDHAFGISSKTFLPSPGFGR